MSKHLNLRGETIAFVVTVKRIVASAYSSARELDQGLGSER